MDAARKDRVLLLLEKNAGGTPPTDVTPETATAAAWKRAREEGRKGNLNPVTVNLPKTLSQRTAAGGYLPIPKG